MRVVSIRLFFAALLIVSMLGLSACNMLLKDWKVFALGVLYSIANVLIFFVK